MDNADYDEQRAELLQSIDHDRREVRDALHELTGAAALTLGIRDHIKQSPLGWALAAFLVGAWLGDRVSSGAAAGRRES